MCSLSFSDNCVVNIERVRVICEHCVWRHMWARFDTQFLFLRFILFIADVEMYGTDIGYMACLPAKSDQGALRKEGRDRCIFSCVKRSQSSRNPVVFRAITVTLSVMTCTYYTQGKRSDFSVWIYTVVLFSQGKSAREYCK